MRVLQRLRWPSSRLGVHIAAAILLSVAIGGALAYWRVGAVVHASATDRATADAIRASSAAQRELQLLLSEVAAGSAAFAGRLAVGAVLGMGNHAQLAAVASELLAEGIVAAPGVRRQGVALYDRDGRLLVSAHAPQAVEPGTADGAESHALIALGGTAATGVRFADGLGISASAVTRVPGAGGAVLGAVEVLAALDGSYVAALAGSLGTAAAIVPPDGDAEGSATSSLDGWTPTAADVQAVGATRGPAFVQGGAERVLAVAIPLREAGGAAAGELVVGVPGTMITAPRQEAERAVLLATAAALAFGLLAAVALMRGVTPPLRALLAAVRRIQDNDLEPAGAPYVPHAPRGPRELRELAAALEDARLAMRDSREELMRANRTLAEQAELSSTGLSAAAQDLSVMRSISARPADPDAGVDDIPRQLVELEWVDGALIALVGAGSELAPAAQHGLTPEAARAALELLARAGDDAIERGLYIEDVSMRAHTAALEEQGIRGLAAVPLLAADGVAGLLIAVSRAGMRLPGTRRALLQSIAQAVVAIVERTELTEEAAESRTLAESVLGEMSDGVVVFGGDGRCRACNPAAARLLAVERGRVLDRPAAQWLPLPPSTQEALRRRVERAESAMPLLAEVEGRQLAVTAGPFGPVQDGTEQDGAPGMILLIRDLTDLAEAEELKRDFVSMVGHELRTPLTMIRTSIDLLGEPEAGALTETQTHIVELLRSNSDRLLSLITDLLDMSALESGRVEVQPALIELDGAVRAGIEPHHAQAAQRSITLTGPEDAPELLAWADRDRVQQVVSNLVGNAVKYTPEGGHVTVRAASRDHDRVQVDVRDNGIGIPPAEQPQLFERFYRTRAGRKQSGGTGLGLAIARSLVELHGGEIWCESDGRSGTTFSFTLPRSPSHEPA